MKKYICQECAFIYDESKGLLEDGIAPGTAWNNIPDNWSCPNCSMAKADFEMQKI